MLCPPTQRCQKIKSQNRSLEFRLNRKTHKGEKGGLTLFLPAISPECPLIPINHTCIITMETRLSRWGKIPQTSQNTCRQFYELLSILPGGFKSNASTDLRPKGVSSKRHTLITKVFYTTGRPAKLVLSICTRYQEETKKPKKMPKQKSFPITGIDEPCAHVGKQHATPALNKGQEETCCLTQRNVMLIRSCSRPGSVR